MGKSEPKQPKKGLLKLISEKDETKNKTRSKASAGPSCCAMCDASAKERHHGAFPCRAWLCCAAHGTVACVSVRSLA
eukprot:6490705-Amphidinium_carterae.4